MAFKLPKEFQEKQQEIYNLKYIQYNDEKAHVSDFEDNSISPFMYEQMRMNSYAREDLPPKLTNETLIKVAESYLKQCTKYRVVSATYEEAIVHTLLPELIKRLKEQ